MKNSYIMLAADGSAVFDENSPAGREFIERANVIAAIYDDPEDPLVSDDVRLGDDDVAEAFYHDSAVCYYVRDEEGAMLNYASAR